MANNVYNTTDPEVLLSLKRQEADALRDVIRSFNNAHNRPEQIFKIAQNTLLAQLGVRKMKFIYKLDGEIKNGFHFGISDLCEVAQGELPGTLEVLEVDAKLHPKLTEMEVQYVVPSKFQNEIAAWFLVGNFAESEAEIRNDLIFIETITNLLSAALENRILVKEMVRQESLKRELVVAEKIQKQLLVTNFKNIKKADIFAQNVAHGMVGGDFYDVIPRGKHGFFVCIADVAGKGIGAALLMANLQANIRALILSQDSLKDIIHKLHELLLVITQGEQFVTLFMAHVRYNEQEIDFINAGHNPPLMMRSGKLEKLTKGTIPLGIYDLPDVEEGTVSYSDQDVLLLYTDGLVEQDNEKGEMLGEERVEAAFVEMSQEMTPHQLVVGLTDICLKFAGNSPQVDDVTLLAIRFK